MEVYHFAVFQTALERIRKLEDHDGPNFPDILENPNRGDIMPEPCTFLDKSLPVCSVIRPRNTNTAGAVAAATGLVNSGLFLAKARPSSTQSCRSLKQRTPHCELKASCSESGSLTNGKVTGDRVGPNRDLLGQSPYLGPPHNT